MRSAMNFENNMVASGDTALVRIVRPACDPKRPYQTAHRSDSGLTMGSPALQLKALSNSGMLLSGPRTRYLPGGCGSVETAVRAASERTMDPRHCPSAKKNC